MPYRAANGVSIGPLWSQQATFQWPFQGAGATKLTLFVNGTDAIVQVAEGDDAFQDDQAQEILLRQGFNTRDFPTPFSQWRFKVWQFTSLGLSGTIDMVALA